MYCTNCKKNETLHLTKYCLYIFILMLLFFVALEICGCKENKQEQKQEQATINTSDIVATLENRYDDHFTYSSEYGGQSDFSSTTYVYNSQKYPQIPTYVQLKTNNGKTSTCDNYCAGKYYQQTYDYISKMVSEVFGNNIYIMHPSIGPGTIGITDTQDKNTTFEEYLKNPESGLTTNIRVSNKNTTTRDACNQLCQKFKDNNVCIEGRIGFYDSVNFAGADETNLKKTMADQPEIASFSWKMNPDLEVYDTKWETHNL